MMNPKVAIEAMELNSRGITNMEISSYDDAIRDFSKGLNMVKEVLAQHEDDEEDEMDFDDESSPNFPLQDDFHFADSQNYVAAQKKASADEHFIFRSPIVVPGNSMQPTSFQYYVKLSYVLLYNLALSHHLSALAQATTNGLTPNKKLQKAIALYELAYTIQMTEDIQLSVLQTMAIVNNLGQIHTALGSKEKSQQCFQHLLSTIMFVNDCGDHDAVQQMDGFMGNVMELILKTSNAAPAA